MAKGKKATKQKSPKSQLKPALDELLKALVIVRGWPQLSVEQYHRIEGLASRFSEHEPWRSHLGFFDIFEIISDALTRAKVPAEEGQPVNVADALGTQRFADFVADVWRDVLTRRPNCATLAPRFA